MSPHESSEDRERKNVGMGAALCHQSAPHNASSAYQREAALKDACSQLFQGHAVNRIVGPNETITAGDGGIGAQSINHPTRRRQIEPMVKVSRRILPRPSRTRGMVIEPVRPD